MCGPTAFEKKIKNVPVATLLLIIFGILICIACHLYYGIAYLAYQLIRHLW